MNGKGARCFAFVFACGAVIGPVGDHLHVVRGVIEYLTEFGPIWFGESPLWFVLLVAIPMAGLAVLHGALASPKARAATDHRALRSPLLVLAVYATTSFWPWRAGASLLLVVTAAAVYAYLRLDRTRLGLALGIATAIAGTGVEWALVHAGVFRYLPPCDTMLGVAPWLLPLYFTAAVCAGAVGRRMLR